MPIFARNRYSSVRMGSMPRTIVPLLWLVAVSAWGAVISGVVMEPGVNQPVADVEITVAEFVRQPYKYTEVAKTKTDLEGAFHFELNKFATYVVSAKKLGYSESTGSLSGAQEQVVVDKDHLRHTVRFALSRSGEITGRVVDDETGTPIPNFHLQVMDLHYSRGEAIMGGDEVSPTDADGRFVAKDREPGNYVAQVVPQTLSYKESMMTKFTERDLQTVDTDYASAYWPGGQGLDSASLVQLQPGGSASVGTIRVKKTSFYRVRVSILAAGCAPEEKLMLNAQMLQFRASAGGEVPCGDDFLLRNLQPGSYVLYLFDTEKAQHRKRVVMPFEVTDRNFDVKVSLMIGPNIGGRISLADGAKGPVPAATKVLLQTQGRIGFADENEPAVPDADGNFRFSEVPIARERLTVSGLGAAYYVKEIRYNGIALTDNIFATDGGSPSQSLEVVLDDKPATVSGTVTDGDKPVGKPYVVLVRWPASPENIFLATKRTTGDDNGQFRFTGLAPGDYRILAVSPETVPHLDEPGVLFRILSGADTVNVDRGASQNLPLKLTDR